MIGEGKMRQDFEAFVLRWTGRDVEYHERNQTTGMEFAWECWKAAAMKEQIRANERQFPAVAKEQA